MADKIGAAAFDVTPNTITVAKQVTNGVQWALWLLNQPSTIP